MSLSSALAFDKLDQPVAAAHAYESAIANENIDIQIYLNLAVLYFVCCDGGYATHHKLSQQFLDQAWTRSFTVLDEAEHRFGQEPEAEFWKKYFQFILLGGNPFIQECEQLIQDKVILIPFFYLFMSPGGNRYEVQAEQLLQRVRVGTTAKERYIKSIIESSLHHRTS